MRLFKMLTAGLLVSMLSGCFVATALISNPDQVVVEALSAKSAADYAQRRCSEYLRHAVYLRDGGSAYWFACRQITPAPMEAVPEGEMAKAMSAVIPAANKHAKTSKPMKKMAAKFKLVKFRRSGRRRNLNQTCNPGCCSCQTSKRTRSCWGVRCGSIQISAISICQYPRRAFMQLNCRLLVDRPCFVIATNRMRICRTTLRQSWSGEWY